MITIRDPMFFGKQLVEIGIEEVRIIPDSFISNDSKIIFISMSYQKADQLIKSLEPMMKYTEKQIPFQAAENESDNS